MGWAGIIVPDSAQNMTNKETGELATVNNLPSRQYTCFQVSHEPDFSWVHRPSSFDQRHQPQARSEAVVRGSLVNWLSHLNLHDGGHFASAL